MRLANIEFAPNEIALAMSEGKNFLAKGRTLYAICRNCQGTLHARPIYNERGVLPLVARGRFVLMTSRQANKIVGFELTVEL